MANYDQVQGILNTNAPSTTYKFSVDFLSQGENSTTLLTPNSGFEKANLLCQTATLPKRSNEPMKFFLDGIPYNRPGRSIQTQTITLTFIEVNTMLIHKLKKTLRSRIWVPGTSQRKNEYFTTVLKKIDPSDGQGIWIYTLFDCFLENEETPNFDGNANTPDILSLTIGFGNFDEQSGTATATAVP